VVSNLLLYVVLSSRTSFSFVTGKIGQARGPFFEARLALFEYGLIEGIDIGRLDIFSTVLLESCEPVPNTRKRKVRTMLKVQ
jgi:hypothetical protein